MTQLTPLGTKRLIKSLFGSQLAAARQLGFTERAVRYWCFYGAPLHVGKVLRRVRDGEITAKTARLLLRRQLERRLRLPVVSAPGPAVSPPAAE
jgi:hypothetical protein